MWRTTRAPPVRRSCSTRVHNKSTMAGACGHPPWGLPSSPPRAATATYPPIFSMWRMSVRVFLRPTPPVQVQPRHTSIRAGSTPFAVRPRLAVANVPINVGVGGVYLILFGTGIQYHQSQVMVSFTTSSGEVIETLAAAYAGAQGGFVALDQINVALPRSLAGAGSHWSTSP